MERTQNLLISTKGAGKVNAAAIPMQEGYLMLGAIYDEQDVGEFGRVVSVDPADDSKVKLGAGTGRQAIGILAYSDAIAENSPAHAMQVLPQQQCAVINFGFVLIDKYKLDGNGKEPVRGDKVGYNTTTGEIEFVASTFDSGFEEMTGAKIVQVTDGVILFVDFN